MHGGTHQRNHVATVQLCPRDKADASVRIATLDAAAAVGAEADLGTLEVGKLADIVLLDADPWEDVRNTQSIWRVIKDGWVFDPEEMLGRGVNY